MKTENMFNKCKIFSDGYGYFVFRIIVGLMFFMHGLGKIGLMGKPAMSGLMLVVGVGETLVGLGIVLGLWTRLAALAGAIIMIGAYVKAHLPTSFDITSGGGELALMFLMTFLVLLTYGAGKWSLEGLWCKKECF